MFVQGFSIACTFGMLLRQLKGKAGDIIVDLYIKPVWKFVEHLYLQKQTWSLNKFKFRMMLIPVFFLFLFIYYFFFVCVCFVIWTFLFFPILLFTRLITCTHLILLSLLICVFPLTHVFLPPFYYFFLFHTGEKCVYCWFYDIHYLESVSRAINNIIFTIESIYNTK